MISDDVITAVLSRQYGVPSINLDLFQIEEQHRQTDFAGSRAQIYQCCRSPKIGATLTLAMADPTNVFAMDDIKFMTGLNVEPVIASEASMQLCHRQILQRVERNRYVSILLEASGQDRTNQRENCQKRQR